MATDMRAEVRKHYAQAAKQETARAGSCCGGQAKASHSERLGYDETQLAQIPVEADLGLGCGNPTALGELRPGETVVDLGSGGGIDCFLAARRVGPEGKVIGVDMTPEMLDRSRAAARTKGYKNVEFRLGEIENLPVADESADAVISNCVINLSTEKQRVFREAYRILKPGGRAMISDMMLAEELPEKLRSNAALFAGCVAGAVLRDDYLAMMREAGFSDITVQREKASSEMFGPDNEADLAAQAPELSREELRKVGTTIISVQLTARKAR
ncbi:MAG TPA: arsenite methyltransferase [Spirochaetia bacterium]|nr:arsenite methyltransferase [Spirochaetia bacterium]